MKPPTILVSVAFGPAPPAKPMHRRLNLPPGSTVGEAIRACGLLARCPEIDLANNRVGIFGRLVQLDTPLRAGDRVEIYRPLNSDPKEARRRRATAGRRRE
jgi:putative ubiquitin-RnfH superfamily antitoxin RatB of RatAB toxin-antitoxin module